MIVTKDLPLEVEGIEIIERVNRRKKYV